MAFAIKRRTPPPLMALIAIHFLPHFLFFAIEYYLYEKYFTPGQSKLSFLSPLIIGSKLTTTGIFSHIHCHLNYYMYII